MRSFRWQVKGCLCRWPQLQFLLWRLAGFEGFDVDLQHMIKALSSYLAIQSGNHSLCGSSWPVVFPDSKTVAAQIWPTQKRQPTHIPRGKEGPRAFCLLYCLSDLRHMPSKSEPNKSELTQVWTSELSSFHSVCGRDGGVWYNFHYITTWCSSVMRKS